MESPISASSRVHRIEQLQQQLSEAIQWARRAMLPVIITDDGRPVAAIVEFAELRRLYALEDEMTDAQMTRAFEKAEARGEVEWLTDEEMDAFQEELIRESRQRAASMRAADSNVAGG
ncbi:MAG: hypothetical protein HY332_03955 [Chloroflexi bacterium]|nr:hypothetical protein [Chloroflexota bacterium]